AQETAGAIDQVHPTPGISNEKLTERLGLLTTPDWLISLLYLGLDAVSWTAIYGIVGWFRKDAYYAKPFQFFVINLIQLGIIVAALYFVGGYDNSVEKLALSYAAEHLLAVGGAAVLSGILLYSGAAFAHTMQSRTGGLVLDL